MAVKFEYLTKEIAYPVIARYLKSGSLASSFYKAEGWSEGQFYSWRRRYMKDHNLGADTRSRQAPATAPPPVFHPLEVCAPADKEPSPAARQGRRYDVKVSAPADKQPAAADLIELEYPNGVILRIDAASDDSRLASLIKLY